MMHSILRWISDHFGSLAILTLAASLGSLAFAVVEVLKRLRQLQQKLVRESAAHAEELKRALISEGNQSRADGWDKQNESYAPKKHLDVLDPVGQGASSSSNQSPLGSIGCN